MRNGETGPLDPEKHPWYFLATLHGEEPFSGDATLHAQNRTTWNRYMASRLPETVREKIIADGLYPSEELNLLSDGELAELRQLYIARTGHFSNIFDKSFALDKIRFQDFACRYLHLEGFLFAVDCSFSCINVRHLYLNGALFTSERYNFKKLEYAFLSRKILFIYGCVLDELDLSGATLHTDLAIDETKIETLKFTGASFLDRIGISDCKFGRYIWFDCRFPYAISVENSVFDGDLSFSDAEFSGSVLFGNCVFNNKLSFFRRTFPKSVSFINSEMKNETDFSASKFSEPPKFFGAKLHEGTDWSNVDWPLPANRENAAEFVHAYERMKLEMDRLKRHEDELKFFALELQSRRVSAGPVRGLPITLYGLLCDYGQSYWRPTIGLLVSVAVGACALLPHFGISRYPRAIGLSVANTFSVLGFRRDYIRDDTVQALSRVLKIVSALQTTAGTILLFLLVLAIRNRFRMK
jgi:hypothetical protein